MDNSKDNRVLVEDGIHKTTRNAPTLSLPSPRDVPYRHPLISGWHVSIVMQPK
jgi:hypothetical protein